MSNLLPPSIQSKNRREYRLRFIATVLFLLAGLLLAGIVFLLPSYLLSSVKESAALRELDAFKAEQGLRQDESAAGVVAAVTDRLGILAKTDAEALSSTIAEGILAARRQDVSITGIQYEQPAKGAPQYRVSGIAASRASLQSFMERVSDTGVFAAVELPVSNFVERSEIRFEMMLTSK